MKKLEIIIAPIEFQYCGFKPGVTNYFLIILI